MILSDREIIAALSRGFIRIVPAPDPANPDIWSSTALDLTLDGALKVWRSNGEAGVQTAFDPADVEFDATGVVNAYASDADCTNGFELIPQMFVLGWTVERIQLPHTSRIAARVEGKSSLARIGVGVHVTAPTIHAGFGYRADDPSFEGNPIQLEIWNAGPLKIRLTKGLRICQLIFEQVHGTPNKGYQGQFSIQGPKVVGAP